ncbi:protein serine/threonine phosphatase 2C [Macrolepiota fuliginosa MF-IS2]|uniref:Protein serine/threonine phosphatase 2C n=1 Tax=Macrolepiota fuliginosa MF-IS2 TaxID=1400762 RepID=A0A9P6CAI1_9AGAR|nr:protein serine/threonine phosphatase 2C [Macrolepiota fuliginosa MF-IS2]
MALRLLGRVPRHSTAFSLPTPHSRHYHDYVRVASPSGIIRVPLASPKVVGVATSRGNRGHQEDFYGFATLSLNPEELHLNVKKFHGIDWDPSKVDPVLARQAVFVGIYDGHGGSAVSQYLRQELHGIFESVKKSQIPDLFQWVKHIGGYFKRFRGGALTPWIHGTDEAPELDLEARATQAFFEVDRNLSMDDTAECCGATASVALFHSLDAPSTTFFSADKLSLTVAHCGDTRVLLSAVDGGTVFPMTENHHADAHIETIRLRRMMGSSLITDSFGESRWMGALVNTRCLGDLQYKKFGVTPEPEVRSRLLNGREWACTILISDGVSSMLSDQEVADLARGAPNPKVAADRILSFSEELGGSDNGTVIVVPLKGWGQIQGPDKTKELREYRRKQTGTFLSLSNIYILLYLRA